jgi:glycosyltransferase involved in cell wall biosynthesis
MKKMVSVIIPTYNREALLKRAIESVLNQSYQNFELIIVDDGSKDNTEKLVEEFGIKDERVKYVFQENSGGAAKPKNTGIKVATGEYIAILDDDDEWFLSKLEKQVQYLDEHLDIDIVGCNYLINGKKEYRIPFYKNIFKRMLVTDDLGPGSTMIYRKELFGKVGLFDENLKTGQDREMRIRLAKDYKFGFVKEALVNYYSGHDNISFSGLSIEKREKDWAHIFNKYRKYYDDDSKVYSDKLRYDGTRYMSLGLADKARKCFLLSIQKNPLNMKSFLYLFLSLFGPSFYNKLIKIKLWLK